MAYAQWAYKRVLTDDNSTRLTDHVVSVELTESNFTFSNAKSDGSDVRFYDATLGVELPHVIIAWDSVGLSAQIYVRVVDLAHTVEMYYGNADAQDSMDGQDVFRAWDSFSDGVDGSAAANYTVAATGGLSLDANNNATISETLGSLGVDLPRTLYPTTMYSASGADAYSACRVPHQRCCFHGAGRYWMFYSKIDGTAPYDLAFKSSTDGSSWSSETVLTTTPKVDAQWALCFDSSTGKLHIINVIQSGVIFHDGLLYRRGTPTSDGTITWDADWQTVVAVGTKCGDPSIAVDSNGQAWVGWENAYAYVAKNSATDGTWAHAAGFPVALGSASSWNTMLCPLAAGGMYVVSYNYNSEERAHGYSSSDGSASFSADGDITDNEIETTSGSDAHVGRIEAMGRAGEVHLAYQDTSQAIRYKKRSSAGSWGTESVIGSTSQDFMTSPRIAFNATEVLILWTDNNTIWLCRNSGEGWSRPKRVLVELVQQSFEHMMPAEDTVSGRYLPFALLNYAYGAVHRLLDLSPSPSVRRSNSLYFRKAGSSSGQVLSAIRDLPKLATGDVLEFELWIVSISTNGDGDNNDNFVVYLRNMANSASGPMVTFYGGPAGPLIGYLSTTHHKVTGITAGAWHTVGVLIKSSTTFDLLLDGVTIAENATFQNSPSDLSLLNIQSNDKHTGSIYVDNVRVWATAATEPSILVGDEVSLAPVVQTVEVTGARTIDVTFDMAMGTGVTTAANYTLSGTGKGTLGTNPSSVAIVSGNTYRLTWASGEMLNGGDITITVSSVYSAGGVVIGESNSGTDSGGGTGTAPTISAVSVQTGHTIDVTFSEAVTGATTAANYTVGGTALGTLASNPDAAVAVTTTKFRLVWASGSCALGTISVVASGITDAAGNTVSGTPGTQSVAGGLCSSLAADATLIGTATGHCGNNGEDVVFEANASLPEGLAVGDWIAIDLVRYRYEAKIKAINSRTLSLERVDVGFPEVGVPDYTATFYRLAESGASLTAQELRDAMNLDSTGTIDPSEPVDTAQEARNAMNLDSTD